MILFHPMDFLIFIAFGIALWAQFKVKGNFSRWSQVRSSCGLTGAEVARRILDAEGLYHVDVELSRGGTLSDHYDPIARKVRLSEEVYYGNSIASLSVAAHEVGHAIQHKVSYPMLVLRHRIFPIANFGSALAPFLLIAGFLLQASGLIGLGILFFSGAVAFQLVTLPVEFNASARAGRKLVEMGFLRQEEMPGVKKVLGAAALTYVASALVALLELLKYVMIFANAREE